MTETSQHLPRNPTRFAHLSPDPVAVLPAGFKGELGSRTSLQTATEGLHTPDWILPVKSDSNRSD